MLSVLVYSAGKGGWSGGKASCERKLSLRPKVQVGAKIPRLKFRFYRLVEGMSFLTTKVAVAENFAKLFTSRYRAGSHVSKKKEIDSEFVKTVLLKRFPKFLMYDTRTSF